VSRLGFGFGRLAQGAGDALEPVAEKSVDRMLAGPLPEAIAQSLVRHHVLERVVSEIVASPEFRSAFTAALQDERTEQLVDEFGKSALLERLVRDAVTSPAVVDALTAQTTTIGGEMVASLRRATVRADAAVERPPRRWLGRPPRALGGDEGGSAGVTSRGLALVLDILIAQLVFLVVSGSVALVTSLAVGGGHSWWYGILAGVGWLIVQAAYFIGFWASAGRTPAMALMGLRVRDAHDRPPGVLRSAVRLVGLWIAIAIVLLGFVPALVDDRRRALQDYLAGTEVVYSSSTGEAASPAVEEGLPG
jgi:uncharacterized RDD family membrane protein YckC